MNEENRSPICLALAASYLVLIGGYLLYWTLLKPYENRGASEGVPANFESGLIVDALAFLLYVIGFILIRASLARREKFRTCAYICLGFYYLPVAIWIAFLAGWIH